MIILHDFGFGLLEYSEKGKENKFPVFERCPNCNCISHDNLHQNGYYRQYGIDGNSVLNIPICQFKCLACRVNSLSYSPNKFCL